MFINNSRKFFIQGSMMVEVLIVSSVIVISVLTAMNVAQKSIFLSKQSVHQSQAALLLEEGSEIVRINRDNSWSNISELDLSTSYYPVYSGGAWVLSTSLSQVGIFTRTIVFEAAYRDENQDLASSGDIDNQTKLVTIDVSWNEGGQSFSRTLQFYITDLFS